MNKKHFIITLFAVIFAVNNLISQTLTNSPYTRYGLGDLQSKAFGRSVAMGNVGIGLQPNSMLNIINPAASSGLLKYTFLLEAGFAHKTTEYISTTESQQGNTNTLSYLAMGFPVTEWWASGFGLLPYSGVGYNIIKADSVTNGDYKINYHNHFVGNGGINQIYWNNSFKFLKKYSVGANLSYMFGSLDRTLTQSTTDVTFSSAVMHQSRTILHNFNYNLGVQYSDSLNKKTAFTLGAIFSNEQKLKGTQTLYTSFSVFQNGLLMQDTIINDTLAKGKVTLPLNYGFGVSFVFDNKWTVAADFQKQNWSKSTFFGNKEPLSDSWYLGFGAEYAESRIGIEYWKLIRYRIGGHYAKNYYALNNKEQFDYGISFGFGIPMRNSATQINISCELGTKGKAEGILLQEKYAIFSVNFNMLDAWFVKRRFN